MRSNQEVIAALTGYDTGQLNEMVFDQGVKYAEAEMGQGPITQLMLESSEYWTWWKYHWNKIDADFLAEPYTLDLLTDQEIMRSEYQIAHSHNAIMYGPSSPIIRHSYMQLAHQLAKELTRKEANNG